MSLDTEIKDIVGNISIIITDTVETVMSIVENVNIDEKKEQIDEKNEDLNIDETTHTDGDINNDLEKITDTIYQKTIDIYLGSNQTFKQ